MFRTFCNMGPKGLKMLMLLHLGHEPAYIVDLDLFQIGDVLSVVDRAKNHYLLESMCGRVVHVVRNGDFLGEGLVLDSSMVMHGDSIRIKLVGEQPTLTTFAIKERAIFSRESVEDALKRAA